MKIDRMIGILAVLLKQDRVTAPELAERFEVSKRTINRDIEALCRAGIPIMTTQGSGGGIRIMDGYRVDRTLLTSKDMQMILAGLRSLDSVSGNCYYAQLMEKLMPGSSNFVSGRDYILIDLSSWYKVSLAPKLELIQEAITGKRLVTFMYYSPRGESRRTIEPYYLVFRWSSWYLWGWCSLRREFRLFKLNRMEQVEIMVEVFEGREVPYPELSDEKIFPGGIKIEALFRKDMKWRLVEEFGMGCFTEQPDGRLLFHADYTDMDNAVSWLLTFGDKVKVLKPVEIRREIESIAKNIQKLYL